MTSRNDIPDAAKFLNFDPLFCRRVARITAAVCVLLVIGSFVLIAGIDPAHPRCPGWYLESKDGASTSIWMIVGLQILWAGWMAYVATHWEWFSSRTIERLETSLRSLLHNRSASDDARQERYEAQIAMMLDFNILFVIVGLGSTVFCSAPLLVVAFKCI